MRAALDGNEIRTRTGLQQFDEDLLAGAGSVNLVHDKRISELGAPEFGTDERQPRSEEHTSELQSLRHLVCRLLLEKTQTETGPRAGRTPPTAGSARQIGLPPL